MAKITVNCEQCGAEREVDERLAGGFVSCSECGATVQIPLPGLGEGAELGNFILIRQLGVGAMGEVWLARQKTMDRVVALKLLSRELTFNPDFVSRFRKEVQLSAKLDHPNMVTAFDAGCENDIHFLAISFIDGEDLSELLAREGSMPEQEAVRVLRDIARGLDYAWNKYQILHRDIKPSNIMIDRSGVAKLMDMGISKSISEDAQLTMTGSIMGTPYYMSPEQAVGDKELDCRTDIYSLGATLYHLVTGTVPFDSTTTMGIVSKHLTDPFPPPQERNPEITDACAVLLETMMAKKPEDRQKDWQEVIRDMELVIKGSFPATTRPAAGASVVAQSGISPAAKPGTNAATAPTVIPQTSPSVQPGAAPPTVAQPETMMPGRAEQKQGGGAKALITAILIGFVLALGLALFMILFAMRNESPDSTTSAPVADSHPLPDTVNALPDYRPPPDEDRSQLAAAQTKNERERQHHDEMWQVAVNFAKDNPENYDQAIANFEKISGSLAGTKYQLLADVETNRLRGEKDKAVRRVMDKLQAESANFAEKKQFGKAVALLENYDGRFAEETRGERENLAAKLHEQAAINEEQKQRQQAANEEKRHRLVEDLCTDILHGRIRDALAKHEKIEDKTGFEEIEKLLRNIAEVPRNIIENIKDEAGNTIELETDSGMKTMNIIRVQGPIIIYSEKIGKATVRKRLAISKLAQAEIARRSGLEEADKNIFMAVHSFRREDFEEAERLITQSESPLRDHLLHALKINRMSPEEKAARERFAAIVETMGLHADEINPAAFRRRLEEMRDNPEESPEAVMIDFKQFADEYRQLPVFREYLPFMLVIRQFAKETFGDRPEFQDPRDEHDNRFAKRPGRQARDEHGGGDQFITMHGVKDIQEALIRNNPGYRGQARILGRGRQIEEVILRGCREIRDIRALRGLPIRMLDLSGTEIEDISPLRDMQTLETLSLDNCRKVQNIAPLANLENLREINLHGTGVSDISPLKGMRLEMLNLDQTRVSDISVLKNMPLRELRLEELPLKESDFQLISYMKELHLLFPAELWKHVPGKEHLAEQQERRPGPRNPQQERGERLWEIIDQQFPEDKQ